MLKLEESVTAPMKAGLVVGIPFCGRPVTPEWAMSMAVQNYPMNTTVRYCTMKGEEVGKARNKIVEDALKVKAKYVWFVDDDTAPPCFAIRHLIYALEKEGPKSNAMVVGGIYCAKSDPATPTVFRGEGEGVFWDWKVGQIFDVTGIGTGCMLCKTEIFEKIPAPWFVTVDEDVIEASAGGDEFCKWQVNDDLYFCANVIKAGYRILAHGGVLCVHWDVATGRHYMLPPDCYPMQPESPVGPKLVAAS